MEKLEMKKKVIESIMEMLAEIPSADIEEDFEELKKKKKPKVSMLEIEIEKKNGMDD